ncbi:hypothetical protein MRS76_15845 [Rhizobiaceae bacterium n13]|uniref:Flagellar basal body-associated FliL family protein n=1 Tax=Ferirhizobium litorale TaxID=2927786 RepID=A0AAE3QFM4_9HYPH|nr:hypothetical protein [Fererhizobium litorale]MDI7863429.1 hypothetical protein [Fererhizobium litorale]MDI7922294.1 hypothetical protein [Fererhizobium litorale]
MIKLVLTGLWVCAVTLGSVYLSIYLATAPVGEAGAENRNTELVPGEMITVPVISDGKVAGYFLTRISFTIDKEKVVDGSLPLNALVTDELFTLLIGNKVIDIANTSAFDLNGFRTQVKQDLNKRLGGDVITEVLVEQLDYLSKDDTRNNSPDAKKLNKKPVTIVEGAAVN